MTDVVATHCRERQQPAHHGFGNNSMTNAGTLNGEFITCAPRDPTLWGDAGRLIKRLLPDGRLHDWRYSASGELQEQTDGDDIRTVYLRGSAAHMQLSQAPDGQLRASVRPGLTQRPDRTAGPADKAYDKLMDDFGRAVQQDLPDHGLKTALYDASNRLVALRSADGSTVNYHYDHAGRLLGKTYRDAAGVMVGNTTINYRGIWIDTATDPAQTTRYRFDALGRPSGESITLQGLATSLTTGIAYDTTTGLVRARTLADGRVLRTQRNDPSQGASATALTLQTPAAAWLHDAIERVAPRSVAQVLVKALPSQRIASDLRLDPFDGLLGYTAGNGIKTHRQFDIAGRMTALNISRVAQFKYQYGAGPRIQGIDVQGQQEPASWASTRFDYDGFGALARPLPSSPKAAAAQASQTARNPQSQPGSKSAAISGAIVHLQRDALGRAAHDGRYHYTYTPAGQIETVSNAANQPFARYTYNAMQQRVSKTAGERTTHYLWQQGRLVAEISSDGTIQAQYLYLSEGQRASPIAKLEPQQTYFIHSDHRAAPLAMTDQSGRFAWSADLNAWGQTTQAKTSAASPAQHHATLNLRLPGHYFDEETGLHDNWHRTYDPTTGHYLQPDPLGYHDGPDPYLYAGGDPVNKADPTGLYEEDMHYYMLFFLALTAGMDYEHARITALASQYIDDNPMTRPLDDADLGTKVESAFKNHLQLVSYHFVLSDSSDINSRNFGYTLKEYNNNDVNSVVGNLSPQLRNLLNASDKGNPNIPCAKYQFLGEFLHAYADTFSHRNGYNMPYDAFLLGAGVGHGFDISKPDYTYNGDPNYHENDPHVNARVWNVREARTLAAERAMFEILKGYASGNSGGVAFSEIEETVIAFNKTRQSGPAKDAPDKVKILQIKINELIKANSIVLKDGGGGHISEIDFGKDGNGLYSLKEAETNRNLYLGGLKESDYPGTCLPGGVRCKPV